VASAADDFIKGVYVQSEELCANATKSGLDSVLQEGNVILTARGIEGVEYNCEFLQVMKATRAGLGRHRTLPGTGARIP
jgi:hypothetical protein